MPVGHSLSGLMARLFRQVHPNDVVVVTLVDTGHERKFIAPGRQFVFPIVRGMAAVDLTRLLFWLDAVPPLFLKQEESVQPGIRPLLRMGLRMQTRYFKTITDECTALEDTCAQVRRASSLVICH